MQKEMTLRQKVLKKTNGGLHIYSHILSHYRARHENEIQPGPNMRMVGRDCGICFNPFAGGSYTLHLYLQRRGDDVWEQAYHETYDGSLPPGNAIDFAQAYFGLQGLPLFRLLNEELYLRLEITDKMDPYEPSPAVFSYFRKPIRNIFPYEDYCLVDVFNYIRSPQAAPQTYTLRQLKTKDQRRDYKAANFDYCTFCGLFDRRGDDFLIKPSGLICLDFDDLPDTLYLKKRLLKDTYFETQLLFVSPSGHGLKWVIPIKLGSYTQAQYFERLANYIFQTYGVPIDPSGKDLSRACFLPHDPNVYINPQLRTDEDKHQ